MKFSYIAVLNFFIFLISAFVFSDKSYAQALSETALFHRCYSQITSQRVKTSSTLYVQVKSGSKTAVNACLEVLASANLSGTNNEIIANTSDSLAKSTLANFHRLHSSWFLSKDYPTISWSGHTFDIKDLIDSTTPALYITRALFRPNTNASDIITNPDHLVPVRTNMDPATGSATSHTKSDFIFSSMFSFAPFGELLGLKSSSGQVVSFPANPINGPYRPAGSVNIYDTLGGGFVGTQSYRLLNLSPVSSGAGAYKTDGGLKMHRVWGKAFYNDALCRTLPVVRESDVVNLVKSDSTISFRTSAMCTRCHASQDRLASVIRNQTITYVGLGDPTGLNVAQQRGGNFVTLHTINQPAESSWPTASDPDYYRRPATGKLFFRDYKGDLIDQNISTVADLGQKTSQLDDFYICLSKRYYNYFLGIDVKLDDFTDTDLAKMSQLEKQHRDTVIQLGKNLKSHQNLQQLIKEIISLNHYRKLDFGAKSGL